MQPVYIVKPEESKNQAMNQVEIYVPEILLFLMQSRKNCFIVPLNCFEKFEGKKRTRIVYVSSNNKSTRRQFIHIWTQEKETK